MYDQIARYYDLTHADLTEDLPLILELAGQADGPILELGCGSGRLLLPLARAGHTVTGIDNSTAMLALAQARLAKEETAVQNRTTLIEADMTKFELAEQARFPLIIIPYNTFMHLDAAQKTAALKQIKRYLAEDGRLTNGRLFIDLINPFDIAQTPDNPAFTLENSLTDPETGHHILQFASNRLDAEAQILHIDWIYDSTSPDGEHVQRTTVAAAYHYLFPHQLELLLRQTGFQLQTLAGGYDQSPYNENSDRLLIIASNR
ncbi:MAG: class I SAM-dependent methyltransferase [Chloroflexi bacterium]|nr:class I SAM-dependent methyltransferase [Chloroflexota bacterium]